MDRAALAAQLKIDEGMQLIVYKDTRGHLTVGCGHLVRAQDHLTFTQAITAAQCQAFLEHDIDAALTTCHHLWPAYATYPEEVQQVTANLAFNVGQVRLQTFVRFIAAVKARQWSRAAAQMRASLWYQQVGERAKRLVARMAAVQEA